MSQVPCSVTDQQLLYFPFMTIPSRVWLRQALLYWDGIAVFADERWAAAMGELNPDVGFLINEGLLTSLEPNSLFVPSIVDVQSERDKEITAIMQTPLAKALQTSAAGEALREWFVSNVALLQAQVKTAEKKISLEEALHADLKDLSNSDLLEKTQARLANGLGASVDEARRHAVLRTAIHWGLLARDFGAIHLSRYVPSTDAMPLGELLYSPVGAGTNENVLGLVLSNAFPLPADNTGIEDVMRFKERNQKSYVRFRLMINEVAIELESAGNPTAVHRRLMRFARDVDLQRHELAAKLRRRKLEAVLNTVDVVLNTDTSPFLETIGGLAFASEIPLWWKAAALGAPLVLGITKHAIRERNMIADEMTASPVAYLHSAKRKGVLREAFPIRRVFRKVRGKLAGRGIYKKGV